MSDDDEKRFREEQRERWKKEDEEKEKRKKDGEGVLNAAIVFMGGMAVWIFYELFVK